MIDGLKPYPECKDSGSSWLGKLPAHWNIRRIKTVLRESDCRSTDGCGVLLSLTRLRGLIPHRDMTDKLNSASTLVGYKQYGPGQIVMNRMQAWSGMFGAGSIAGLVSPDYAVFDILGAHLTKFILERLKAPDLVAQFALKSKGIGSGFNRLYTEHFGPIPITLPPIDEQPAIVRFLDHANGRIDRAIRAKKKLIALLNEEKQAIIHHAVTRGLDSAVFLKPSGVPWLGEIPHHWEKTRIKHCITRVEQGWSPQCDAQPASEGEWGVLKVGCVNKDDFRGELNKKLPSSLRPDLGLEIKDGDVLVSRANTPELLGLAALAVNPRPKLLLCDKLFRFRPLPSRFDARFLVYRLRCKTSRAQIESSTNGASSSMQNIGQGVLKNLWVSAPDVDEQKKIVAAITADTNDLTLSISRAEHEIALLREYRTRLTADVVTGKLDVREAARKLPDTAEEAGAALEIEELTDVEPEDVEA